MLSEVRTDVVVLSRATGVERRFSPGRVVELRRDPAADFPVMHERVSRRAHAELVWTPAQGWVLRDVSGRGALFVDSVARSAVQVDGPRRVRLGDAQAGEELEIRPDAGAADTPRLPSGHGAAPTAALPQVTLAPGHLGRAAAAWRLSATVGATTTSFAHDPAGRPVTVGRDPGCDITIDEPTVSRHHADLLPVGNGWRFADRSSAGSWIDGVRTATVHIDHPTQIRLGDPLTGSLLNLDVAVPPAVQKRRKRRSRVGKVLGYTGAVAVVTGVALTLALVAGRGGGSSTPAVHVLSQATLLAVERSTVKLDIIGADGTSRGWGSGTIIDRHGLILTNSHVADPNALGLDTQYGSPLGDETPAYLVVELRGAGPDGNVHARYRARKVISDGYLDLALVQIYADAHGQPVRPSQLNLPALPIGNSNAVRVGEDVTVVGFPGVSQSRAATVTKGDASAFVHDARLHSDRAWIETTARIAHGNSGGAAVNDSGQLIGVPTRIAPQTEGDVGWWFRPVNWVKPLLARVRAHHSAGYVTPYVTPARGVRLTPVGWSGSRTTACSATVGAAGAHAPSGAAEAYLGVAVSGLQRGLQFNVAIRGPAGYLSTTEGTSSGTAPACFTVPVLFQNGDGRYYVTLSVDPPGAATKYADIAVGVR